MTGKELIDWIVEHHAEDMLIAVQYRDAGGDYFGGELVTRPILAHVRGSGIPYSDGVEIAYAYGDYGLAANAVIV